MNELECLKVYKIIYPLLRIKMPLLLWIRYITIPALFNFTKKTDFIWNFWNPYFWNLRKWNVYCFFTLFFIPLIPLFCRYSVRIDEDWNPVYKRKVSAIWWILNQAFWIIWLFILMWIIWGLWSSFSGWHFRVRAY
jgi:hypothetical protein